MFNQSSNNPVMNDDFATDLLEMRVEDWLREIGELRRIELVRFTLALSTALKHERMPACSVRTERFPLVLVAAAFPGNLLPECQLRVRLAVHRAFNAAGCPVVSRNLHLRGTRRRLRITAKPEWGNI